MVIGSLSIASYKLPVINRPLARSLKKLPGLFLIIERISSSLKIEVAVKYSVRMYNTSDIFFKNTDSQKIMLSIGNRVAASRGSACSTNKIEPSHVLSAMGVSEEDALSAIRFSFGRYTTEHEVDVAIELIIDSVKRLSGVS